MNDSEFLALLQRMEGETLDFKSTAYNLISDSDKADFIKDVTCMANTPREEPSYILLGVKKHTDGTFELWGLDRYLDDADLQAQFPMRVQPVPEFAYEVFSYEKKDFGIITIPPRRIGPCLPIKDFPGPSDGRPHTVLRQYQIYFRRGSRNDTATSPEDIQRIMRWVEGTDAVSSAPGYAWEEFLCVAHRFEPSRKYILLVPPLDIRGIDHIAALGKLPWSMVFDFDPDTETAGLQKAIGPVLESYRSLHRVVLRDRPTLNPDHSTYWFYARGLSGRADTISAGVWREWKRQYGNEQKEQLNRLTAAISPAPVTCIALWYDTALISHLRSFLEDALSALQDTVEFVILTKHPADLQAVAAEYDAVLLDIPFHHLCSGLQSFLPQTLSSEQEVCELPSSSGAPIALETQVQQWLEEELEFVHLSAGSVLPSFRDIGREFLRGTEIDWYELSLHTDIDRDKTVRVKRGLESALERKRAVRINLYHDPGAGGTTVARRILWELHRTYPCAILHRCKPAETVERLFRLASLTGQAILVLVDGAQIADRQVDELFNYLRSRLVPVVLFQTLRRFVRQSETERAFHLPAKLSGFEAGRFVEVFSRQEPQKRAQLEKLARIQDDRTCTAFYFGLETFGRDFLGLEPYIGTRLADLTPVQKQIMGFLALAHHYAQQPIRAQAFVDLLGFPKNRVLKLSHVLPPLALELLAEVQEEVWRTAHDLFAQEILEQILWPNGPDRRLWRQNLSSWAKEFVYFCRGESAIPSEDMKEIASRTFIYRDNADLLGTEQSAHPTFAQLIDDIPSLAGKVEILRQAAELYPEEAHFWAHLGRFYAVEIKDFQNALLYIERAITLQGNDHILYHMKGMALRYQASELMRQGTNLEQVITFVKLASEAFEEARRLDPDDPYGYISEVQMLARVLDYTGRHYLGGLKAYWSSPTADTFLRDSLERAENLLEQVRRNREGEGASPYEEDCRGKIDALYGRHEQALQIWNNLLDRRDVYYPPLRRQIVWTYLARRGRSWDSLQPQEVERVVNLLEKNLQEEPNSDQNIRLWVQAVRRLRRPPSIEAVTERVSYWKANSDALDPIYYLYVFNVLQVLVGSVWAREDARRYIEECRQKARFRRNRTKSLEWLGVETGISRLVYYSELGKWLTDKDFWENTQYLARVQGRIARIDGPQSGQIEIEGGLYAFFVPARGDYSTGRSENKPVDFYLGFSYDGLRAWEVKDV
ncbi:MAG TPA: RNA-binding domain-containing protein [Ktedonobacteraceae bacterium]|nr:RNA-binding domain-containing protein [Ktedonobacteraceae bacterium]